jgi:hypothetical protein
MSDGHLNKCKDCAKLDVSANYRANRNYYKSYDIERNKKPERRESRKQHARKHKQRNPDKAKARNAVGNALRHGTLIRQPCEMCGEVAQAHHEDYSKPLEVKWLCFKHHRMTHGQGT